MIDHYLMTFAGNKDGDLAVLLHVLGEDGYELLGIIEPVDSQNKMRLSGLVQAANATIDRQRRNEQ